MKKFLLYLMFWVLAFAVSALVGVVITAYSIYDVMALSGKGDPQLMAGMISEQLVGWTVTAFLISVLAYPLYFGLKSKLRFPSLTIMAIFCVVSIIRSMFNGVGISGLFTLMPMVTIFCMCLFIFFGLTLPGIILRKIEKKRNKSQLAGTFD